MMQSSIFNDCRTCKKRKEDSIGEPFNNCGVNGLYSSGEGRKITIFWAYSQFIPAKRRWVKLGGR
jgi:hypothetical protein